MAVTQFCFTTVEGMLPAAYFAGAAFEIKNPTGTSAATTAAATPTQNICRVATDTAVYVTFAAAPTATSANGFLVPANGVEYFRVQSGHKAAVVTA